MAKRQTRRVNSNPYPHTCGREKLFVEDFPKGQYGACAWRGHGKKIPSATKRIAYYTNGGGGSSSICDTCLKRINYKPYWFWWDDVPAKRTRRN